MDGTPYRILCSHSKVNSCSHVLAGGPRIREDGAPCLCLRATSAAGVSPALSRTLPIKIEQSFIFALGCDKALKKFRHPEASPSAAHTCTATFPWQPTQPHLHHHMACTGNWARPHSSPQNCNALISCRSLHLSSLLDHCKGAPGGNRFGAMRCSLSHLDCIPFHPSPPLAPFPGDSQLHHAGERVSDPKRQLPGHRVCLKRPVWRRGVQRGGG